MESGKITGFDNLIDNIYQAHRALQENTLKVINRNLTIRNRLVGYYIVVYEQNGEDRAKYGVGLIEKISEKLRSTKLKGFSVIALRSCRMFYLTYPQIRQTLSVELRKI